MARPDQERRGTLRYASCARLMEGPEDEDRGHGRRRLHRLADRGRLRGGGPRADVNALGTLNLLQAAREVLGGVRR